MSPRPEPPALHGCPYGGTELDPRVLARPFHGGVALRPPSTHRARRIAAQSIRPGLWPRLGRHDHEQLRLRAVSPRVAGALPAADVRVALRAAREERLERRGSA